MDRVSKVVLRGDVGDLVGKLKATSSAVRATASSMTEANREAAKFRQGLTGVGDTAGKIGLVAAAGVAYAVKKFADFDQAISQVAATGQDAKGSLDELREAALQAGARTVFSATESANAIEELAKAGESASDILGGALDGSLDLAAAGGLDVADAASIAATTLNQFGLAGDQASHVADLLASASNAAQGDVTDMAQALKYVGPVAAQMGVSLEETTGTIAELASQGILADQAGTSLRGMLSSLTSPSKIASNTMADLGINVYDAQGSFVGFRGVAEQLQTTMGGLSNAERDQALGRIFGNEQITAARILYAGGASDVDKWTKAVDVQNAASDIASERLNNLKGDLEQLSGAFETAFIGSGEGANGPLREMVQLLTGLVNGYSALPGPVKSSALGVAGLTAALGGSIFVASKAISGYSSLKENLGSMGTSLEAVNKKAIATRVGVAGLGVGLAALSGDAHNANADLGQLVDIGSAAAIGFGVAGPWGAAIGGSAALLTSLGGASGDAAARVQALTATLDQQTGAVTKNTSVWAAKELRDSGVASKLAEVGVSLTTATQAALGNADALDAVREASKGLGIDQNRTVGIVEDMAGAVKTGKDELTSLNKVADDSSSATSGAATGIAGVATAAQDATTEVKSLSDQIDALLDPLLSQDQAMVAWKRSIQSLSADLIKNGGNLDSNTKKGQDNRDAIRDRVQALKDSASADLAATGNQEKFASKLERGAKQIIAAGTAAHLSRSEIKKYVEQLGLTPENIETLLDAQDAASPKIKDVKDALGALDGVVASPRINLRTGGAAGQISGIAIGLANLDGTTATTTIIKKEKSAQAEGGEAGLGLRASGSVVGAGTGTSDSIPALLSNGEHVLTAAEVQKAGGQDAVYRMRAAIRSGSMPAFAEGGAVSRLDIKRQQATVRDIEQSLREKETVGKGKNKHRQLVLRGLDRQIAQLELSEAKRELRDLKSGKAAKDEAAEAKAQAAKDAAESLASTRASAKSSILSQFSIDDDSTTLSVERNLTRLIANAGEFTSLLASLKRKGASPWLLAQLVEAGPTGAAIRLARQYNTDSAALASINAQASVLDKTSNSYASLISDPRFMAAGAWNSGYAVPTAQAPMTASIVGAQIEMGTNGFAKFVQGQIVISNNNDGMEARFATL